MRCFQRSTIFRPSSLRPNLVNNGNIHNHNQVIQWSRRRASDTAGEWSIVQQLRKMRIRTAIVETVPEYNYIRSSSHFYSFLCVTLCYVRVNVIYVQNLKSEAMSQGERLTQPLLGWCEKWQCVTWTIVLNLFSWRLQNYTWNKRRIRMTILCLKWTWQTCSC